MTPRMITRKMLAEVDLDGAVAKRQISIGRALDVDAATAALVARFGSDALDGCRVVSGVVATGHRPERGDGMMLAMLPANGVTPIVMDRFDNNGVVLWGHNEWQPSIGRAVLHVDEPTKSLHASIAFLPRDISERAYEVGETCHRFGHAFSISFSVLSATAASEEERIKCPWATDVWSWRMLEISAVTLGADPFAIVEASAPRSIDRDPATMATVVESMIAAQLHRQLQ